jgi:colanic acid/amylovoran biosynthesis protein
VLDRADVIAARDEPSIAELKALGVNHPLQELTADAALVLPQVARDDGATILRAAGVDDSQSPLVGISVRRWTFPGVADARRAHADYIVAVAEVADQVVADLGATIVFLSTAVGEEGYPVDDRVTAGEIIERMHRGDAARVVTQVLLPSQIQSALGSLDLFIATRMHAAILGSLAGVPLVAIAYEPKTTAFMSELDQGRFVCDIDTISADVLLAKVLECWDARDAIGAQLRDRLPPLRARSWRTADLAMELAERRVQRRDHH